MFYGTYRLLTRLVFGLSFPMFLVYALITGRHRTGLKQRLGLYDMEPPRKAGGPLIWLHGASVGEIKAAEPLVNRLAALAPEASLVVTAVTEQGLKLAQRDLGNKATCLIAPLDLPGAANRAIRTIRPDIYLCLETELWPNTLAGLRKSGAACFLLNARLSERSFRRYRQIRGFARQVLGGFSGIAAISDGDAARLLALGATPEGVTVSGNVKYDQPPLPEPEKIRRDWQRILGLDTETQVLVAGSTHPGEEQLMLEAFRALKASLPGLVLILAPRHLERLAALQGELASAGADCELLSQVKARGRRADIVVVDTMGELSGLYAVGTFVFCGGSLVDRGGHNIMEAARWGRPVFYGPSMKDFTDAKELLESCGGGFQIGNITELTEKIRQLAAAPRRYRTAAEAARLCASAQNGAAERQLRPVLAALARLAAQKKFQPVSDPA